MHVPARTRRGAGGIGEADEHGVRGCGELGGLREEGREEGAEGGAGVDVELGAGGGGEEVGEGRMWVWWHCVAAV